MPIAQIHSSDSTFIDKFEKFMEISQALFQ